VRSELHTFLSDVVKRELKRKPEETERGLDLDRLEKRIREALMPHVLDTADAVLHHLHPIDEVRGLTSEIFLNEVDPQHLRPVRNLLIAGSSLRVVARDKHDASRFFVHADLYSTLARIRARELAMAAQVAQRPTLWGGALGQALIPEMPRANRLLTNGRADDIAPPPSPADEELRAQLEETFMGALGLTTAALRRIADPAVAGSAVSAAIALKRQAPTHHGLNEQLKLVESENHRALEQAQTALVTHYAHDSRALDLIGDTAAEIGKLLPALILLPEGGLFDRLIGALEDAQTDGPLSGDEDVLLKRLRKLKEDLDRMDWNDQAAWSRVQRQIEHLSEAGLAISVAAQSGGKFH